MTWGNRQDRRYVRVGYSLNRTSPAQSLALGRDRSRRVEPMSSSDHVQLPKLLRSREYPRPPLCTRVVIGMRVGEGVPKDRSDRRCDVLSAVAFGRCGPGAAWFGGLVWACWRSVAGAQECAWGAGDPALVAVGGPAPLDGEDPVHVRGQQGVNHVCGFGAVEAGVERAPGRPRRRQSWIGQCDAAGGSRPAARLRRGRTGRPPSAAVVPEPDSGMPGRRPDARAAAAGLTPPNLTGSFQRDVWSPGSCAL